VKKKLSPTVPYFLACQKKADGPPVEVVDRYLPIVSLPRATPFLSYVRDIDRYLQISTNMN
jgi:hypothetical protein